MVSLRQQVHVMNIPIPYTILWKPSFAGVYNIKRLFAICWILNLIYILCVTSYPGILQWHKRNVRMMILVHFVEMI